MRSLIITFLALFLVATTAFTQNTFKAVIKDAQSKEALIGASATLKNTTQGGSSDNNGLVEIVNVPKGS